MVLMQQRIEQGTLAGNCLSTGAFADDQRQQPLQGLIDRGLGAAKPEGGSRLCRMRLTGTIRRGGRSIQPRLSSFSNKLRAAMSLSWPAPLRQFHNVANS